MAIGLCVFDSLRHAVDNGAGLKMGMPTKSQTNSEQTPPQTPILPDFCENRTVLLVIVVAELLAIVLSLTAYKPSMPFFVTLAYTSLFIQAVALFDAAAICLTRRFVVHLKPFQMFILVYCMMQCITLLMTFISSKIMLLGITEFHVQQSGWQLYGPNLLISLIISALLMRYFYVQNQWQEKLRAESAIRIGALQARIRPHFLFNSMNTIANLVYEDPSKAENAVLDLADLYRATLAEPELVTLEQEIKHANGYLRIEKIRLGDRLTLEFIIAPEAYKVKMPSMILQPLVENAVYHGIESVTAGGVLEVHAQLTASKDLRITITNPLPDSPRERHHSGNRMAINNIKQRLLLTYGKKANLSAKQTDQSYIVELLLPTKSFTTN